MDAGKFAGMKIGEILNLHHTRYLRWIYFNYSNLSFDESLLKKIGITKKWQITKPGKNPELGIHLNKIKELRMHGLDFLKNRGRDKKKYRNQIIRRQIGEAILYSKANLAWKNQGH